MTRDNTLSRGVIGSLALTLTFGVSLTAVRADVIQPLPRPTAASAGDEARWLERLPPATRPLPRPIDVAQSDTSSLQEALKLLESRVESGAFESAPRTAKDDKTPAREPIEPVEPNEKTEIPVSAPQPPALPAPPVAPAPPAMPVAPEPIETPVANPLLIPEAAEKASPPVPETPPATSTEPSRDESSEDAGRAPQETAPKTTAEPVDERVADTPEPIEPTTHTGRWQVQLLAGRSLSRVERDRDDLRRFHGDRVSGLTLTISQANPNGLYRLRALDWASQAEAGAWCRHLRTATGLKCMVVRGDESPAPGAAPIDTPPSSATR
ncbi:SPOR domain-containing protein [Allochromatium tepidum]|uniref:SPOR domain-containing protein n=1 Tax=Allochromatium tepidum TaxID=553982 RepID=A0ABM7QJ43_9GAMM|nr:SPOR domain-containing protein [Allochromatium tepidum]BCU05754.1 hypothetical protein Atep_04310 [Allochromatium tepidum]